MTLDDDNNKYVIWEKQSFFHTSAQDLANKTFNILDQDLKPSVFIIGILDENSIDRPKACLEPDDCGFEPDDFFNIKDFAKQLEIIEGKIRSKNYQEDGKLKYEIFDEQSIVKPQDSSYIEAIEKIVTSYWANNYDYIHFYSDSIEINGYTVFIVMKLNKLAYQSYYSLINVDKKYAYPYSGLGTLLEAVCYQFMKVCEDSLKKDNVQAGEIKDDPQEIILKSGKLFIENISRRVYNFISRDIGTFEMFNIISSMKYEGQEGLGKIILTTRDHPNVRVSLQLEESVDITESRKVRKLLELVDEESYLICNSSEIIGLGHVIPGYNPRSEDLFIIEFKSHYSWQVSHDNNLLMNVAYYRPMLPKIKINYRKFYSDTQRLFKNIEDEEIKNLWEMVLQSTKQRHGTIVVICENAENEAKRLGNQSFRIKPQMLDKKLISVITNIDGAVLMDYHGKCYAIGVILDGIATKKGDSSRGSRYNSAIRYFENIRKKQNCLIIIVSEDGMVDIIPDLKPRIYHSEIINRIEKLVSVKKSGKSNLDEIIKILLWLEENEFYLTKEECKTINSLVTTLKIQVYFSRKFKPSPEMNESYYEVEYPC